MTEFKITASYSVLHDHALITIFEVNIVMKGGNYGWPYFEGDFHFHSLNSSGGNNNMNSTNFIPHVMDIIVPKLTGTKDVHQLHVVCMVFAYGQTENPENSGNFTNGKVLFSCAHDSPLRCKLGKSHPHGPHLNLNYVYSMGRDNKKDFFLLTSSGMFRISHPSRCNCKCSKENFTASRIP
ncbi:hypothetical protein C5167_042526 [Papaver somniferum]|uniref:Glucose/Sorbosone dehydrogenase domain-containing protein n=1 Tax=Papaver somniferum TaxID=3469 RepID=A0A4Y7L5P6_PAPSO|nr:hypothetical protein C5167_042526 [Papaver somniferum]